MFMVSMVDRGYQRTKSQQQWDVRLWANRTPHITHYTPSPLSISPPRQSVACCPSRSNWCHLHNLLPHIAKRICIVYYLIYGGVCWWCVAGHIVKWPTVEIIVCQLSLLIFLGSIGTGLVPPAPCVLWYVNVLTTSWSLDIYCVTLFLKHRLKCWIPALLSF
jgi:hypothetical protein